MLSRPLRRPADKAGRVALAATMSLGRWVTAPTATTMSARTLLLQRRAQRAMSVPPLIARAGPAVLVAIYPVVRVQVFPDRRRPKRLRWAPALRNPRSRSQVVQVVLVTTERTVATAARPRLPMR